MSGVSQANSCCRAARGYRAARRAAWLCAAMTASALALEPPPDDGGGWVAASGPDAATLLSGTAEVVADASSWRAAAAVRPPPGGNGGRDAPGPIAASLLAEPSERIRAVARALDGDWRECFRFVRDEIAWVPVRGFSRGADRTLLDRAGGDADQALLLLQLLRASGHGDASLVYLPAARDENGGLVSGVRFPFRDHDGAHPFNVASWLGFEARDSQIDTQVRAIGPLSRVGMQFAWNWIGQILHVGVERFWVRLPVFDPDTEETETIDLDPAFKPALPALSEDLASASGLALDSILSAAGGTTNEHGCAGLDAASLEALLATNAIALCNAWGGASAPCRDRLATPATVPFAEGDPRFPGEIVGEPVDVSDMSESALSQFVAPVSLSVGEGAEFSAFLHEMAAKRIDVRFRPVPGGTPGALAATLERDGAAVSSETNAAASSQRTWRLAVAHPRNPYSATGSFAAATNFVHCLVCGFDGMSADGLVAESSRSAAAVRDDAEMRGPATARLSGDEWIRQSGAVDRIWSLVAGTMRLRLYKFGFASFDGSQVINMPIGMTILDGDISKLHAPPLFTSALEHSVIEQMRGTSGTGAVSTARLLALANAAGESVFLFGPDMAPDGVPAALGLLHDYSASSRTEVSNWLASGRTILAPASGDISLGDWHGVGYWGHGHLAGTTWVDTMRIFGGLHGGYAAEAGEWTARDIDRAPITSASPDAAVAMTTAADPVDLSSGALVDSATDLALPGLEWTRSYDSRARFSAGDLGRGWSHPFEARVSFGTDPEAAFGGGSLAAAAPTLVAMAAADMLVSSATNLPPGETARRLVAAALVADWWTRQLAGGTAIVSLGAKSLRFARLPDGSYAAAPGVRATLSRTDGGGWALEEKLGKTWLFDSDGRLSLIRDRSGNGTMLFRDASGRLSRVESPFGFAFDFTRDSEGRIASVADSAGRAVSYAYDARGNITNFTDAAGASWPVAIDGATGVIAERRSPSGALLLSNSFDPDGRVTNQVPATGGAWTFGFASGLFGASADPNGARETARFDAKGRLRSRTDALGATSSISRDGAGRPAVATDALGTETHLGYDESGDPVFLREAANVPGAARETALARDALGRVVAATNALGATATFAYDPCDRIVSTVFPDGSSVSNEWTASGLLAARTLRGATGPPLRRDEWEYGANGLPSAHAVFGAGLPASGVSERFEWTLAGLPAARIDALGRTNRWTWDARGLPLTATDPTGATTSFAYDADGNLAAATDALGRTATFSWNPDSSLASAARPSGATDSFAYDALGRMVAATNALGAVFAVEYDAAGRAILLTDALGGETDISRDALGQPTDTLDPMGRHRAAAYDALVRRVASVRPSGATDAFAFDALDALVAITNSEGRVLSIARDAMGCATAATNAAGEQVFSAEWTPLGLASRTDGRGVRLDFNRDATGVIINTTLPTGMRIRRAYDADGSLVSLSDSFGHEWAFGRDAAGRRVAILHPGGQTDATIYDLNGRVSAWDADGVSARTLVRNAAGECDEEFVTAGPAPCPQATFRLDLAFDEADRPASGTLRTPGAAPHPVSFLHDGNGTLTALSVSGTNVLTIAHDAFGLPSFTADASGSSSTFLRDPFGAVVATAEEAPLREAEGSRDHAGSATVPGVSPPNTQHPTPNSGVARLWAIDPADPLRRPALECASDGTPIRVYLWAEDRLLGFIDAATGDLVLAHCDEFGSVIVLTDAATSNILFRAAYSPFGENWGRSGVNPTPFFWLGSWGVRELLPQASATSTPNSQLSTLHLTAFRLYSPTLRRFLSPDPLGPAGGINLYAYAAGDPLSYIDFLGLCSRKTNDTFAEFLVSGEYWSDVGLVWKGYGNAISDTVSSILHPIKTAQETWEFASSFVQHPGATAKTIGQYYVDSFSDPESFGEMFGGVLITVTTVAAPYSSSTKGHVPRAIMDADRIGSALKTDPYHRSPSYLSLKQLENGTVFEITGYDGVTRTLLQTRGGMNGSNGIFEFILDPSGRVTHQRFIPGGTITGFPNQTPRP